MTQDDGTVDGLDEWLNAVCEELGIELDDAVRKTVLNLARVVAHTVDRPAAPLTAYFLGVAVGRGEELAATAERLQRLAHSWSKPE
ncbi:MAG TPA: DUF6457 domain-containing protein [Streptosporangiaceae bacterium]|nr:DUF6457 domain-containing protein [Streptosporangiaceae bacterium]